jgi:3',5'-cyclic AMP phosphodiesterase CpdA
MRVAVLSDTHFGDPLCTLVSSGPREKEPSIGPAYEALARAVGKVDYLVLLGDIVDFSVASYADAYRQARCFFRRLSEDGLTREIVYVPGNHDFDVWHTVEHQVNVINRLRQGQLPRSFKRSVPGVIDDRRRNGKSRKFLLPDVVPHRDREEPEAHYGNLFFDDITREASNGRLTGRKLNFNFAYPNLYLVTDEGESLLLTHGHYFEAFWSVAAEWTSLLAFDDLELEGEAMSLREVVGINLPLHQLACTGIGQALPLSQIARTIQREAFQGRTDTLEKYFQRLERWVRADRSRRWPRRLIAAWVLRWAGAKFRSVLASLEHTRYSREFLTRPSVRERFRQYYRYSLAETERLLAEHGVEIPRPTHVVFGHTHQPIPWEAEELADVVDGHSVTFCNTGGWLLRENQSALDFVGAEVLLYETGSGVRSVSIRTEDVYPPDESTAREARSRERLATRKN